MKDMTVKTISKENLLTLLREWNNQRPGLDPREYGLSRDGWLNYRQESARITKQREDALTLLRACELSGMTEEDIKQVFGHSPDACNLHIMSGVIIWSIVPGNTGRQNTGQQRRRF